jgi:hypothetical protein
MSCPLEYISVSKNGDSIHVDTKEKSSSTPEPTKIFSGPNKFIEFKKFWNFLSMNIPNFNTCNNPLANDPEYINANISGIQPLQPIQSPNPIPTPSPSPNPYMSTPYSSMTMPTMSQSQPSTMPMPSSSLGQSQYDTIASDLYISQLMNDSGSTSASASSSSSSSTSSYDFPMLTYTFWFRIIFLFSLIFILITYIPRTPILLVRRILICSVVCLIYSLIDIILYYIMKFKKNICGC